MRYVVFAFALAIGSLTAQPLDDRRISGRVVDETGKPVANAVVTVWRLGGSPGQPARDIEATTKSAADGTFAFNDLFPTHWLVDAETPTHTSSLRVLSSGHAGQASANVSFSGVAHARNVVVTVYPVGSISGLVRRPDGTPLPDARVTVTRPGFHPGYEEIPVKTNPRGEYRIDRLPLGSYVVSAVHFAQQDFEARRRRLPVDYREYVETFHPATPDLERATAVAVRGGAETSQINIQLAYERGFTIVGRIARLGGQLPAKPISLEWGARDGSIDGYDVVEGSSGEFAIRNVVGEIGILARAFTDEGILNATTTVTVSSGSVRNVLLMLAPAARVYGRLVIEGNLAIPLGYPGVEVALQPPWTRSPLSMTEFIPSGETLSRAEREPLSVPVLPDGTFEFTDVIGERAFAVLNLPEGWKVGEIRHRGRVIANGRVTLRPREVLRDVEIHIATR